MQRKNKIIFSVTVIRAFFIFLLALTACTKQTPQTDTPQEKPTTLNVYTWTNYFSPQVIKAFEASSGVKVVFSYFSSNEELLAKLQAGAKGYDVIVPSGYVIKAMKTLGLLMPLDASKMEQYKNLDDSFKHPPFDPNLEYVMPFAWGTTGLAVNTKIVKDKVDSWSVVFDQLFTRPELRGQITMLDDAPDVLGAALKYLGHSLNERSPEKLNSAKQLLKKQKKFLKAYSSETIPLLESGEVAVAQSYSSDVAQVMLKHPQITYVIPKEGSAVWVDTLAIPKGSAATALAKEFIGFVTTPQMAALQVEHLFINPVVNLSSQPHALKRLKEAGLLPSPAQMKTLEYNSDESEQHELISKMWTELKAD